MKKFNKSRKKLRKSRSKKNKKLKKSGIVSGNDIIKYNANWWKNTPNETYTREDGYSFPTNELTAYTLSEIGNDLNIVKLNQYCISLQGQPSTVSGENTTLGKSSETYVYQREYLNIMILNSYLDNFLKYFDNKCILVIEQYYIKDKLNVTKYTNDIAKRYFTKNKYNEFFIWLTATQDEKFENTKYITNENLKPESYKDLNLVDDIIFKFNDKISGSITDFVNITLINPFVGLSDNSLNIFNFKLNGGAGSLNEFILPQYTGYKTLVKMVIEFFEK